MNEEFENWALGHTAAAAASSDPSHRYHGLESGFALMRKVAVPQAGGREGQMKVENGCGASIIEVCCCSKGVACLRKPMCRLSCSYDQGL